jgi:thiamine monophosphate kinase
MVSKTYSLRPPAVARDGLETLFRVEMKKDDMAVDGIKPGDAIIVTSQSTGKGGVGIAYLSSDTAKSQGNNSFVKVQPKLRDLMGLELSDKCFVSKYEGSQRRVNTVTLSLKSTGTNEDMSTSDLTKWARVALCK